MSSPTAPMQIAEEDPTVCSGDGDSGSSQDTHLPLDEHEVLTRGHPGHLTPSEAATLDALRQIVDPDHISQVKYEVESDDVVLCRYLRARKFDLQAAATMIRESVARRQQDKPWEFIVEGPDACLDCPESAFKKFYPHYFVGHDKWGRPVLYDQVGRMEYKAIQCVTDVPHMVRYHWYSMLVILNERYKAAQGGSYKDPRFGLVSVLDLQGLSLKSLVSEVYHYIREVAAIDQLCFPEMLGKMFIINAPSIFVAVWKVIKGWLDPKTVAKIEILGGSPSVWKERLALHIPIEEIPQEYGGKGAPLVPLADESAELITVGRASTQERQFRCVAGQTLQAELYLACGEVEYTILHGDGRGGKLTPLLANHKTPANRDQKRVAVKHRVHIPEGTAVVVVRYKNPSALVQKQFVIYNRVL